MKVKSRGNEKGKGGKKEIKEIWKVTEAEKGLTYFCAVYCRPMTETINSRTALSLDDATILSHSVTQRDNSVAWRNDFAALRSNVKMQSHRVTILTHCVAILSHRGRTGHKLCRTA
jgi:hypothetical protein